MADTVQTIKQLVAAKADTAAALAKEIWNYAELSYEETRSAAALIGALKNEGFTIEEGIAGIPTAFTATYAVGSGKPVVGFLAEYDALAGLSQKAACPVQEPITPGGAGHGCGHNLLGTGCYAAAVALKDYLEREKQDGTVIFFGCPPRRARAPSSSSRAPGISTALTLPIHGTRRRSTRLARRGASPSWARTSPLTASRRTRARLRISDAARSTRWS